MDRKLINCYRRVRQHQMATYGDSGLHVDGVNQRQFTGGGAAYGEHAYAAYLSAKSTLHFLKVYAKKEVA